MTPQEIQQMKDEIERWRNSQVVKDIEEVQEKKKQELRKLKNLHKMKNPDLLLTKADLMGVINTILKDNNVERKDEDYLTEFTFDELYGEFIKGLIIWGTYLKKYEIKEDYEMCGKILTVLQFLEKQIKKMTDVKWGLDKEYILEIEEAVFQSRKQINENWGTLKF